MVDQPKIEEKIKGKEANVYEDQIKELKGKIEQVKREQRASDELRGKGKVKKALSYLTVGIIGVAIAIVAGTTQDK